MLEEMVKNTRRRPIFESATTERAELKTLPLIVEKNGRQEVRTLKLGDTGLEEVIQYTAKGEPVLVASKHPIGKENEDIVKVVILTVAHFSEKEPSKPVKKSSVINLDQDISKPWYFTHT